jgi:membrane protease YdiL (CAAX protease family)
MERAFPPPTSGLRVVRLLWRASRRRAAARSLRQRQIMGARKNANADAGLGALARLFAVVVVCGIHAALGWFVLRFAPTTAASIADPGGRIAVSDAHWPLLENLATQQENLRARQRELAARPAPRFEDRQVVIAAERSRDDALNRFASATRPSRREGAGPHNAKVKQQFETRGIAGFVRFDYSLAAQLARSSATSSPAIPVLTLILACWLGMLVCQGEGLELDVQRRRHPMWEWLLSHPIRPAHAFYTELLAPLMANPVYLAAPLFLWVVLGHVFQIGAGFLAALLAGLPLVVAASAFNKAIETTALLRLGVRTRGAVLGVLSWFGYIAMFLPVLLLQADGLARPLGQLGTWLAPWVPAWPMRALFFGWGDTRSLTEVVLSWWLVAAAFGAIAIGVTHRATSRGLQAPSTSGGPGGASLLGAGRRLGADPLRRKELLWLLRDKGAIVQVVLIPLSIAATQLFNFSGLYRHATVTWSMLCGLAIICGTYFLLVLGPRSLASEGGALWIALTWPRGLEDLLKAKARLWGRVANVVVGAVLVVTCILFPAAWWQVALVGCGWLVFSSTLALKAVSLVNAPSSSGEAEPPNRARQWIAMLGTLAFGIGVITQAWHTAIIGIVFSSLVSVAMWQGLRARLPYLFDPWSERPVPAPSLLHTAVGVTLLVEFIGIGAAVAGALGGSSSLWLARALGYGLASAIGCLIMQSFLQARGVTLAQIIRWSPEVPRLKLPVALALGIGGGITLGLMARGYVQLLEFIPLAREALEEANRWAAQERGHIAWFFLLAVVFAPVAEEYFFRGLLFRALHRELGDWRALALSATFFAIFHPPLAWVPVAAVGVLTAWLFRTGGHLLACVASHMAYNATVLLLAQHS